MENYKYVSPGYQQRLESLADLLATRRNLGHVSLDDTVEFPAITDDTIEMPAITE